MENSAKRSDCTHQFQYPLESWNANLGITFDTRIAENLGLYHTFTLLFMYQHARSDSLGKYIRKGGSCSTDNYLARGSKIENRSE